MPGFRTGPPTAETLVVMMMKTALAEGGEVEGCTKENLKGRMKESIHVNRAKWKLIGSKKDSVGKRQSCRKQTNTQESRQTTDYRSSSCGCLLGPPGCGSWQV